MKLFGSVFCGGFGLLCVGWMFVVIARGEYLTAVVLLGFAMFCLGLLAISIWPTRGHITPRVSFDAAGTTIRPDRRIDVFTQLWLLVTAISTALFAIFGPMGKLDIPVGREQRYSVPFMAGAVAIGGAITLFGALRRGSMKYVRLTPTGFDFEQGFSSAHRAWGDVKDVTDQTPDGKRAAGTAIVMLMSDDRAPMLTGGTFTPGGDALRELVRFYWQHPEARSELTDGRALERLAEGRFEPES